MSQKFKKDIFYGIKIKKKQSNKIKFSPWGFKFGVFFLGKFKRIKKHNNEWKQILK